MSSSIMTNINDNMNQQQTRKKKCHGNRRDQRFRKKCRTRQMKPETIEKLLRRRKQIQNTETYSNKDNQANTTDPILMTNVMKRKRTSSTKETNINRSLTNVHPSKKKLKNGTLSIIPNVSNFSHDNNSHNNSNNYYYYYYSMSTNKYQFVSYRLYLRS